MVISRPQALVLSVANDAYESGHGRLTESLPVGERGDLLADYLAERLAELNSARSDREAINIALGILDSTIHRLEVLHYEVDAAARRIY